MTKKDLPPGGTLAEVVEKQLLDYIRQGGLQAGDLLPKEEELAAALEVSRHIVREGISRLKVLGIVEARKHRGTVIVHPEAFDGLKKVADMNLLTPEECREFMEMRVALELGMAHFIYLRKTPEAIAGLRKLAGEQGEYIHEFGAELAFHSALLAISGNSMAGKFRELIYNAFYPIYAGRKLQDSPACTVTHCEICDALEKGTFEEFQQKMCMHFVLYLTPLPPANERTAGQGGPSREKALLTT
ncbi:MAG: FadR family transcriptional regulator [Lentisphaeria bacterium]|nr:FadR family transcriptional regulator [Lentisphaeria bacterium]